MEPLLIEFCPEFEIYSNFEEKRWIIRCSGSGASLSKSLKNCYRIPTIRYVEETPTKDFTVTREITVTETERFFEFTVTGAPVGVSSVVLRGLKPRGEELDYNA